MFKKVGGENMSEKSKVIILQGISCSSKTLIKDFLTGNLNVREMADTLKEYSEEESVEIQTNIFKLISVFNQNFKYFDQVLTTTTRNPRPGEEMMIDYRFVSKDDFKSLVEQSKVLEHVKNFGDFYGTLFDDINPALESGNNVVAAIDVQGALKYIKHFPTKAVMIHMDSDIPTMVKRLEIRESKAEDIKRRIDEAPIQEFGKIHAKYIVDSKKRIDVVFEEILKIIEIECKSK